jgi:L-iditol 2-dehydrogenase
MRAAVYYNNSDVRVEEVELPSPGPSDLLVRVEASGICGSDVMEWYRMKSAPVVLGHEIAGVIEDVGEGVKGFEPGQRVTVSHHVPCNTCRYCLSGDHSVCDTLRTTNFDPGGFAEFGRVPAVNVDRGVFPLPENVSFDEGSFAEPLGCVVRGFGVAGFSPGRSVLVIGSGIAGLLHVKLARALGAGRIIATDINDFRLAAAAKYGADLTVRADESGGAALAELVRGANSGRLADFVFVCASPDPAIAGAFASVERGGTVLFFAPREPGETYPMPLFDLWRDGVTIKNSYASCPGDTALALELISAGRVGVEDMITNRLALGEAQRGFDLVASAGDSIKVIIECHR